MTIYLYMYRPHRAVSGKDLTRMSGRGKLDSHSVIGGNGRSHGNTSTPVDTPSAAPPPADTPPCSATPVTQRERHTLYSIHCTQCSSLRSSHAQRTAQIRCRRNSTALHPHTTAYCHGARPHTTAQRPPLYGAAGYTTSPAGEQGRLHNCPSVSAQGHRGIGTDVSARPARPPRPHAAPVRRAYIIRPRSNGIMKSTGTAICIPQLNTPINNYNYNYDRVVS